MRYLLVLAISVCMTACGGGQSEFNTHLGGELGADQSPAESIYDAALAESGGTDPGGSIGGGSVNPGGSPGGDPPSIPSEDGIEIGSFLKVPGVQNDTFWSWDWEVSVNNVNSYAVDVVVNVLYYNADFTILHTEEEIIHVPAGGSSSATGTSELSPADGANVAAVEANIELA